MMDMPAEEEATELDDGPEEESSEPSNEFDMEADAVFNTALPMSERRTALKNAIMSCLGTDYGSSAPKERGKGGDDMLSSLLRKG